LNTDQMAPRTRSHRDLQSWPVNRQPSTVERPPSHRRSLYVADQHAAVLRPTHELRAFRKVLLQPGETVEVVLDLDARALSYWHPGLRRWVLEGGESIAGALTASRSGQYPRSAEVLSSASPPSELSMRGAR
jgi:hypothetical protein